MFFLYLDWGYVFWKKTAEVVSFSSYNCKGRRSPLMIIAGDINLHHMPEIVFVRFPLLWKEVTMCSLYLRGRELFSIPLKGRSLCVGDLFILLPFTYIFNHLLILAWTHIYLFFKLKKIFLLLFHYSCLNFLPIPPPHPSQSHLPPPPLPSPLTHIYFILWVISQHHVIYFFAQIVSALATGSSFS